jgi:tRNA (guanine-N7-)-methyltransferase
VPIEKPTDPPERLIHSYGRRRGRRLRRGRTTLLDDLLPRLAIPAPAEGAEFDLHSLFGRPMTEIWLEIGFGGGEHLAAQAESHRDVGLIGAEPYINGIAGLLTRINDQTLDNVRLWPNDIRLLLPRFPAASLRRVFVLFPDPWPKVRHHKRRLISAAFLDELARLMPPGAELRLATDDADYLTWMLERLIVHPGFEWQARRAADWETRPADSPGTRYEEKAQAAGRQPVFLQFIRRDKGLEPPPKAQ